MPSRIFVLETSTEATVMAGFSWPPDTREKMAVTAAYAKPVANAKNTILMPYTAEPHVEKA